MPIEIYIHKARKTKTTGCDLISYLGKHLNNSFHLAPVWETNPKPTLKPLKSEPYIDVILPTNWDIFIPQKPDIELDFRKQSLGTWQQ